MTGDKAMIKDSMNMAESAMRAKGECCNCANGPAS